MVHERIVYHSALCPYFSTNSKRQFNYHKRCVDNPKHFSCEKEGFKSHLEVKHDHCQHYKTNSKNTLDYHTRHVHSPKGLCPDYKAINKPKFDNLWRHVQNPKLLSCDKEGCSFTRLASCNSLKDHKLIYSMRKPYHCNMCGKGYNRPYKLR